MALIQIIPCRDALEFGGLGTGCTVSGGELAVVRTTTGAGAATINAPSGVASDGGLGNMSLANSYTSFDFKAVTLPASLNEEILAIRDSSNADKMTVRVTSAGKLQVYDSLGLQMGSDGATTLPT